MASTQAYVHMHEQVSPAALSPPAGSLIDFKSPLFKYSTPWGQEAPERPWLFYVTAERPEGEINDSVRLRFYSPILHFCLFPSFSRTAEAANLSCVLAPRFIARNIVWQLLFPQQINRPRQASVSIRQSVQTLSSSGVCCFVCLKGSLNYPQHQY